MAVRLYRRPRSPFWYAEIRLPSGGTDRFSTKERTKGRALVVAKERIAGALPKAPSDAITLTKAMEAYRRHKVREKRRPATLEVLDLKRKHLERVLGPERDIESLTLLDAERYIDVRRAEGVGDHTIHKEWAQLRGALRYLRRHDLYDGNVEALWPAVLAPSRVYTPKDRWLTPEEARRLWEAFYPARRPFLAGYLTTGLRRSELLSAYVEDGKLVVTRYKGGRTLVQRLSMNPKAAELFEEYPGPWLDKFPVPDGHGRGWVQWKRSQADLHRYAKKAGIEPLSLNDLRRTFCSWLCQAGASELKVMRLMGHSSATMVRRVYAHFADSDLAATASALDPHLGFLATPAHTPRTLEGGIA
jgi:integrase